MTIKITTRKLRLKYKKINKISKTWDQPKRTLIKIQDKKLWFNCGENKIFNIQGIGFGEKDKNLRRTN